MLGKRREWCIMSWSTCWTGSVNRTWKLFLKLVNQTKDHLMILLMVTHSETLDNHPVLSTTNIIHTCIQIMVSLVTHRKHPHPSWCPTTTHHLRWSKQQWVESQLWTTEHMVFQPFAATCQLQGLRECRITLWAQSTLSTHNIMYMYISPLECTQCHWHCYGP